MSLRRIATTAAVSTALLLASAGVAFAAPVASTQQAPAPIGPECRPNIVTSVLAALAQNGTPIAPGQKIQYLQVSQRADGSYFPELCTVTAPR